MTDGAAEQKDIVIFSIVRPSKCGECGDDLAKGSFILRKDDNVLCMECADLDHLCYLHSGSAVLTRRARKHSRVSPVVVRWSRSRNRYERQGVLVELDALERAEEECLADEDFRERRRERNALRRAETDVKFVAEFSKRIREHYPGCPEDEANRISEHACEKHSGRVGRTAAAKEFNEEAINLAVHAAIRHRHTRYDKLLVSGWDRFDAREEIRSEVQQVADAWREPTG